MSLDSNSIGCFNILPLLFCNTSPNIFTSFIFGRRFDVPCRSRVSQACNKVKATISWERACQRLRRSSFFFGRNRRVISSSRASARASVKFHRTIYGVEGAVETGTCSRARLAASRHRAAHHRGCISRLTGPRRSRRLIALPLTSSYPPPIYSIYRVRFHLSRVRIVPGPILPAGPVVTAIKGPSPNPGIFQYHQ